MPPQCFPSLPHAAEAVFGQLPVVPVVDIIEEHQSGIWPAENSGPVPRPVIFVRSRHDVSHGGGLHCVFLKNKNRLTKEPQSLATLHFVIVNMTLQVRVCLFFIYFDTSSFLKELFKKLVAALNVKTIDP